MRKERKKERKEKYNECTFKPNTVISNSSVLLRNQGNEEVRKYRGVDEYISRIQDAQKRKMDEAAVFLLPSQKKKILKEAKQTDKEIWRDVGSSDNKNSISPKKSNHKRADKVLQNKLLTASNFEGAVDVLKGELRSINFTPGRNDGVFVASSYEQFK